MRTLTFIFRTILSIGYIGLSIILLIVVEWYILNGTLPYIIEEMPFLAPYEKYVWYVFYGIVVIEIASIFFGTIIKNIVSLFRKLFIH